MAPAMKAFSRQLIFLLFLVLLAHVATAHGGVCRPEKIQTFNYANLRQLTNVQGTIFLHTKTTCLGRLLCPVCSRPTASPLEPFW